jgi:hypothetical protein
MIAKLARAPKGGGSARGGIRYILGYELGEKNEPSREAYHDLIAESLTRDDAGVGRVWSPTAGQGRRPSSILALNLGSLATAAIEMEAVARANVRVKTPIHHLIYSWSAKETATLTDEQMLVAVQDHLQRLGLGDHQAVLSVHRDTEHAHVHVAVGAVNPYTLRAWDTIRNHYRMAWYAREVEAAHGFEHDRGAAVWDEVTQSVRWADAHEKAAWRRESTEQRLDDYTRRTLNDHAGLETPESYAMTLAMRIGSAIRDAQARGEALHAADVHLIAAQMGAWVSVEGDEMLVTLVTRVERAEPEHARERGLHGDREAPRSARYKPLQRLRIDLRDVVGEPDGAADEQACRERVRFLRTLEDATAAELSYAAMVRADPSLVSRGIVARGKATFDVDDIYGELSSRISDGTVVDELRELIEREDKTLLVLTADTEQRLYTTRDQHALETRVKAKVERLVGLRDEAFDERALDAAIRQYERDHGYALSEEQLAIVRSLRYRLSPTQGDAGTGKTTAMAVLAIYAQMTGRDIVGVSTSERATRALAEAARIHGVNVAQAEVLEARGKQAFAPGAIVIYDESSMLDLASFDRALDRALERGASLLVVGDGAQIQSIGAGSAHAIVQEVAEAHGRLNTLTHVRRQQGPLAWMRPVVPALGRAIRERDADAVVQNIKAMERVFRFAPDRETALRDGCTEYVALTRERKDVLLLAGDNMTVSQANRVVRELRGISGGATIATARSGRLDFAVGDRVVLGRNDKRLGIVNGDVGEITGLRYDERKHRWNITVRRDRGTEITFDSQRYRHLDYGYALTAHRAQASTMWGAVVLGAGTTDAEVLHSAMTRATHHVSAHVSASTTPTIDDLAEAVALKMGRKTTAIQFERVVEMQGGPDTVWAKRMRKSLADERDPYRQQHAADNRARALAAQKRQRALKRAYDRQVTGCTAAQRKALVREYEHQVAKIYEELRPRSFVEWAAANRSMVERQESRKTQAQMYAQMRAYQREEARERQRAVEVQRAAQRAVEVERQRTVEVQRKRAPEAQRVVEVERQRAVAAQRVEVQRTRDIRSYDDVEPAVEVEAQRRKQTQVRERRIDQSGLGMSM